LQEGDSVKEIVIPILSKKFPGHIFDLRATTFNVDDNFKPERKLVIDKLSPKIWISEEIMNNLFAHFSPPREETLEPIIKQVEIYLKEKYENERN
jgi:hypothetical protein